MSYMHPDKSETLATHEESFVPSPVQQLYWFQDLSVLTNLDLAGEVFPAKSMSYPQKVNAIVRFAWYLGLLGAIVNSNILWLYVPFVVMILTYILYLFRVRENGANNGLRLGLSQTLAGQSGRTQVGQAQMQQLLQHELHQQQQQQQQQQITMHESLNKFAGYLNSSGKCVEPSTDNPFMNAMPFDNRLRPVGCTTIGNPAREIDVEMKYDVGRYRDANDIWNSDGGRRQFFTMPWTSYPNDQGSFANWLYKTPTTCKEGNGAQCVGNIHDRTLYRRVESGIASGNSASH